MSARKTERLLAIIALWNRGATAAEIGARFGLPRMSVCRLVWEARRRGYAVNRIGTDETNRRRAAVRWGSGGLPAATLAARSPDAASDALNAGKRA